MREPKSFPSAFGVLNLSMVIVCALYIALGFYGYIEYGDQSQGSITLNLTSWWVSAVQAPPTLPSQQPIKMWTCSQPSSNSIKLSARGCSLLFHSRVHGKPQQFSPSSSCWLPMTFLWPFYDPLFKMLTPNHHLSQHLLRYACTVADVSLTGTASWWSCCSLSVYTCPSASSSTYPWILWVRGWRQPDSHRLLGLRLQTISYGLAS